MLAKVNLLHLLLGHLDAGWVVALDQGCIDDKAGLGFCGSKKVEYGLVAHQGLASPILADFAEQTMLDGIPLGGARRVVADSDRESEAIAEAGL